MILSRHRDGRRCSCEQPSRPIGHRAAGDNRYVPIPRGRFLEDHLRAARQQTAPMLTAPNEASPAKKIAGLALTAVCRVGYLQRPLLLQVKEGPHSLVWVHVKSHLSRL